MPDSAAVKALLQTYRNIAAIPAETAEKDPIGVQASIDILFEQALAFAPEPVQPTPAMRETVADLVSALGDPEFVTEKVTELHGSNPTLIPIVIFRNTLVGTAAARGLNAKELPSLKVFINRFSQVILTN